MSIIKNVLLEKCPNCKEGDAFEPTGDFFKIPKMKQQCENCKYKFEREPGYFIGAMYVSYALAIAECLTVYSMLTIFTNIPVTWLIAVLFLTLIFLARKNFKWSRLLYIYICPW